MYWDECEVKALKFTIPNIKNTKTSWKLLINSKLNRSERMLWKFSLTFKWKHQQRAPLFTCLIFNSLKQSRVLTKSRSPDFLPFQLLSGEVIEAMKSQTCENIFPLYVETRTRIQRRARRSETLKCKLICSGWERNQIKMMVWSSK